MNERWQEFKRDWWDVKVNRVSEMASSSSFAFSVLHMSLLLTLWGLWLVIPNGTFTGPPYTAMMTIAPAFTWGLVAMVIGIAKMHFVIVKKSISLAMLCLATGYIWIVTGISFAVSAPANTGAVTYIMLGLYELWLYKRLTAHERSIK